MRSPRRERDTMSGVVTGAGVALGHEFSVARFAAGVYDMILPPGFRVVSALAMPNGGAYAAELDASAGGNRVVIYLTSSGATVDCAFGFVASRGS